VHVHKASGKAGLVDGTGKIVTKGYTLHGSFSSTATDQSVYDAAVSDLVNAALAGSDSFVISYGQTGSGKTHTTTKLIELATASMFQDTTTTSSPLTSVSIFELRGQLCQDLLNDRNSCKVLCNEEGVDVVVSLTSTPVSEKESLDQLLAHGASLRSTASTRANAQSSRSHCFTVLNLTSGGTLTFIDLAGSESKEDMASHLDSEDADARLKEMTEINSSLGDLKECIRLNLEKEKSKGTKQRVVHVPYRRSILTRLLRSALDPEFKRADDESIGHRTSFLAHVAPGGNVQLRGTVNTLGYSEFMVKASREEDERKKFKGPEAWSSKQVVQWVKSLEGSEYEGLSEVMVLTGKQLSIMWKGDVDKRILAAGGSQDNADYIYDEFKKLVAEAKKNARKAEKVVRKLPEGAAFGGKTNDENAVKTNAGDMIYGAGLSVECVENSGK
jgi:hypothetical protein